MLVNDVHELSQAESHILHPGTRALYRHWEGIRAENAAPHRTDLNLKRISDLLPNLVIIERDDTESSYKWRLAGTQTCQLYKDEITGKDALAGWAGFERDTIVKLFEGVVTNLQPCLIRIRLTTTENQVIAAEMIGLPAEMAPQLLNFSRPRVQQSSLRTSTEWQTGPPKSWPESKRLEAAPGSSRSTYGTPRQHEALLIAPPRT